MSNENETGQEKFRRLGNSRLNKAVKAIQTLRGLGNDKIYEATDEQKEKIVEVLRDEVAKLEKSLNAFNEDTADGEDFFG